jgi:hypothetical protein
MNFIRNHKGLVATAAVAGVAGVIFILVWFQPQALFIDDVVNESIPIAAPPTTDDTGPVPTTDAPAPDPDEPPIEDPAISAPGPGVEPPVFPLTLAQGEFIGLAHSGTGTASIIELADGSRILRFENLDVDNGPDLRVILSPTELTDDDGAYDDGDFLDLGVLKGNQGNQNYEIPAGADIDDFATVAIWCRRFNVTFNAAPILAP